MKLLTIIMLLGLAACGGGGTPPKQIIDVTGANAAGCSTEVVNGVLPGVNVDCGAGPVFIPFGVNGAKGDKGDVGTAGTDGQDGTDGVDGQNGTDGTDGVSCVLTEEPENNRVAIDCGGNIIYVPTGTGTSNNNQHNSVDITMLERDNPYSAYANWVVVTADYIGNVIKEVFKRRDGATTNPGKVYRIQHYDLEGEFHNENGPAQSVWHVSSYIPTYKNFDKYYTNGLLFRGDDKPAHIVYSSTNSASSGQYIYQKMWYVRNGYEIQTRSGDKPSYQRFHSFSPHAIAQERWTDSIGQVHRNSNPADISYYGDGQVSYETYHWFGELHRHDGPSHISYRADGSAEGYQFYCHNTRYKVVNSDTSGNLTTTYHNGGESAYIAKGCTQAGWDSI